MAEPEHTDHAEHTEPLPLLDDNDNPSNTPLDLLLNAISGSGGYTFPGADGDAHGAGDGDGDGDGDGEGGDVTVAPEGNAAISAFIEADHHATTGEAGKDGAESRQQNKITRTLREHFATRGGAFSTIEVWHPKTGQKSYGKERRIIQPPPTLRISGPLLPLLTHVTLSAHPNTDEPSRARYSAQSHRFPLTEAAEEMGYDEPSKKDERERRARALRAQASKAGWGSTLPWERSRTGLRGRDELSDGLTFSGLWVGEEAGKNKEFRLELSITQPGVETDVNGHPLHLPMVDESQPLDEAALRHVLGSTSMEPLINLSQAESEALPDLLPPVLDSEVDAAVAAARAHEDSQQPADTLDSTQTQVDTQPLDTDHVLSRPTSWATFVSDPLTIVSKPSQKTAKARSMASCLSTNDSFALFVRVNAQTVRTKLLKLDGADGDSPTLTARAGKWTPFRFEVVARASLPSEEGKRSTRFKLDAEHENSIVTYGSIVRLVDVTSGVKSDCLRLVRVDKNEVTVGMDVGHPVSELQRIGLVRVKEDLQDDMAGGRRWYLSSPGALAGAGEVKTSRVRQPSRKGSSVLPETLESFDGESAEPESQSQAQAEPPRKKRKTKRHALARAVIEEEEQGAAASGLLYKAAERRGGVDATGAQTIIETVQDSMCWVLSSVGCFSYTFFNGLGEPGSLPAASLDPVPRLLVNPTVNLTTTPAMLQLTLSDFFVPDDMGVLQPLSVYLGPIGPLRATTWRSVAPKEKHYDPRSLYDAIPWSGVEEAPRPADTPAVRSNFPHSVPHVIVSVELPSTDEILRAMQSTCTDEVANDVDPWLGVMGAHGELTIQEALHNAGKAAAPDGDQDMTTILGQTEAKADNVDFEMSQLGQPLMDPTATLHDSAGAPSASAMLGESLGETVASTSTSASVVPLPSHLVDTTITMYRPDRSGTKAGAPLPLLLVRPDGVGNGIGWSLELAPGGQGVTEAGGAGTGEGSSSASGAVEGVRLSDWGIRMVQTVARGQALSLTA